MNWPLERSDEDYAFIVDQEVNIRRGMTVENAMNVHVPAERHEAVRKILNDWRKVPEVSKLG